MESTLRNNARLRALTSIALAAATTAFAFGVGPAAGASEPVDGGTDSAVEVDTSGLTESTDTSVTDAGPEQLVSVPTVELINPLEVVPLCGGSLMPCGVGTASTVKCWGYYRTFTQKAYSGATQYQSRYEVEWCGDGQIIHQLGRHYCSGIAYNFWRYDGCPSETKTSSANRQPARQLVAQWSYAYAQAGYSYHKYPTVEATIYPDGTITGSYSSN